MRKLAPKIDHPYIFSVSQVETFRTCPRKWAYLKIDGIEDPGNEASQLGTEVHDELEAYLERGTPVGNGRAGQIAMSGLRHLPPPKYPGMAVEAWFHVKIGSYKGKRGVGAYFRGLKDVEIRKGWRNVGIPFVSDHKSTKNFMWQKTANDLTGGETGVGDTQAGVYAYDTMLATEAPVVDLQWTYMRTTGAPASEPTICQISRAQVDRIIAELELTTAEMIRTKDEHPTASTVVQDPTGCSAFGGCPYQNLCKLTPREKMKALMAQSKKESSVLGKLAARKAAKQGKAPAGETEAVDAKVNPPENEIAPVVTEEMTRIAKPVKAPKKETAKSDVLVEGGGSVLGRAVDAFWNVLVDDLATKIANKLGK